VEVQSFVNFVLGSRIDSTHDVFMSRAYWSTRLKNVIVFIYFYEYLIQYYYLLEQRFETKQK